MRPRGTPAPAADNEQMEFLGDAVLGFVVSRELFQRFPEYQEGELSKLRAHLVSATPPASSGAGAGDWAIPSPGKG